MLVFIVCTVVAHVRWVSVIFADEYGVSYLVCTTDGGRGYVSVQYVTMKAFNGIVGASRIRHMALFSRACGSVSTRVADHPVFLPSRQCRIGFAVVVARSILFRHRYPDPARILAAT